MFNRNKYDYKVYSSDFLHFKYLGNIIPTIGDIDTFINSLPERLKNLLDEITDNKTDFFVIDYLGNSNNKSLSNLSKWVMSQNSFVFNTDHFIPDSRFFNTISNIIDSRFYNKWKKCFETLNYEYDAISPYNMKVTEKGNEIQGGETNIDRATDTRYSDSDTHGGSTITTKEGNQSSDNSETDTMVNDESINSYQGFNSNSFSPVDKNNNTSTNENESSSSMDYTNNEEIIHGETIDRMGYNNYESNIKTIHGKTIDTDRETTRVGNIGNIPQQDLIEKQREVIRYQIFDEIFYDLDSVLTRSKYI